MNEYNRHLDEYRSEYYRTYHSGRKDRWGDQDSARAYFAKYWLDKNEYVNYWLKIKDTVFNPDFHSLPDKVFRSGFDLIPLTGGVIFSAEDFETFKSCAKEIGDSQFTIIQNTFGEENPIAFRMKYPIDVSWEELMGGNYISTALFEMFHNDYFVFGNSGAWGKYVANDDSPPLDLIGIRHKYINCCLDRYKAIRDRSNPLHESEQMREVIESLPASYKTEYLIH